MPRYKKGHKLTEEEKEKAAETRRRNKLRAERDGITVKELKERDKARKKEKRANKPTKSTPEQKEKAARRRARDKEEATKRGVTVKMLKGAKKQARIVQRLDEGWSKKRGAVKEPSRWSAAAYAAEHGVSIEEARRIRAKYHARKARQRQSHKYKKYRKAYIASKMQSNAKHGEIVEVDQFYRDRSGNVKRKVQRPGKNEVIPEVTIKRSHGRAEHHREEPDVYAAKLGKRDLDKKINIVRVKAWPGKDRKHRSRRSIRREETDSEDDEIRDLRAQFG